MKVEVLREEWCKVEQGDSGAEKRGQGEEQLKCITQENTERRPITSCVSYIP